MPGKDRAVDEAIKKAMQEGKFSNLRGEGKPLRLMINPYVDKEWQLAYDMLSRDGYALAWMEKRNQIEKELGEARRVLARTWDWRGKALEKGEFEAFMVENEWKTAQNKFRKFADELNKRIDDLNLEVPGDQFMRDHVYAEKEIRILLEEENN